MLRTWSIVCSLMNKTAVASSLTAPNLKSWMESYFRLSWWKTLHWCARFSVENFVWQCRSFRLVLRVLVDSITEAAKPFSKRFLRCDCELFVKYKPSIAIIGLLSIIAKVPTKRVAWWDLIFLKRQSPLQKNQSWITGHNYFWNIVGGYENFTVFTAIHA